MNESFLLLFPECVLFYLSFYNFHYDRLHIGPSVFPSSMVFFYLVLCYFVNICFLIYTSVISFMSVFLSFLQLLSSCLFSFFPSVISFMSVFLSFLLLFPLCLSFSLSLCPFVV